MKKSFSSIFVFAACSFVFAHICYTAPIHDAAASGALEVVKMLIEQKSTPVDLKDKRHGATALHIASLAGHEEVVRYLLKNGAAVNILDKANATALMYAAEYTKNPEIIVVLLDAGADAKIEDFEGYKAIDYADENENLKDTDAYWMLNDASY